MTDPRPPVLRPHLLAAVLAAAVACSAESAPEDAFLDEIEDTGDLATALGPGCVAGEVCTGSDPTVLASAYRVGEGTTAGSELVQTITATQNGLPTELRLSLKAMRRYTLPEGATAPVLSVKLYAVAAATITSLPASPIASGSVSLGTTGTSVNGVVSVGLTGTTPVVAGSRYAVEIAIEGIPAGTVGTALLGVGAYATDSYGAAGDTFRRSLRGSGGTLVPGAYVSAGTPQVAIALTTVNPIAAPEICAVDSGKSRLVAFPALQNGDGAPTLSFGNLTGISTVSHAVVIPGHDEIIVVDNKSVVTFTRGASGNVAPKRALSSSHTNGASKVLYDAVNDEIWVQVSGGAFGVKLAAFPRTATGADAPLRVLEPTMGAYDGDIGGAIAFDTVGGNLVIAGHVRYYGGRVFFYPRTGSGSVAPTRTFMDNSRFSSQRFTGLVMDDVHGEILIALTQGLLAYSRTASGDSVAPLRAARGPAGYYNAPAAYDPIRDEVAYYPGTNWELVFVPRVSGTNHRLTSGLSGSVVPLLIDTSSGRDDLYTFSNPGLLAYARSAATAVGGALTLTRSLGGSASPIYSPGAIAVDRVRREAYVANGQAGTVAVVSLAGTPTIVRTITGLSSPMALAFDPVNDELWVAAGGALRVFARTASGGATSLRTISGLGFVGGIAVAPARNEVFVANQTQVYVYGRTYQGSTPSRLLNPNPGAGGSYVNAVAFDSVNDEFYLAMSSGVVRAYAPDASGTNPLFLRSFTVAGNVQGLSVDTDHDLIAASVADARIFIYPREGNGGSPIRTITGAATALSSAVDVAFCQP